MLRTKHLITHITEVPSIWVFNHYLNLPEQLSGQNLMIKSVFNPRDRTPSMSLYVYRGKEYKFNDFSTGDRGSKIDLVMKKFSLDYGDAIEKLIEDYNQYMLDNGDAPLVSFKEHAKYRIKDFSRRKWTLGDKKYWTAYHIGSRELEAHRVWPLSSYSLSNGTHGLVIDGNMIYGYFTSTGELYKIYQPYAKERRFMKFKSYIQGLDQLTHDKDTLVITKAMKDLICFKVMDIGLEAIAPDSENMILKPEIIQSLILAYKRIVVVMDNDPPGIKAMEKYKEVYGLDYIISPLEKDPSDSIKIRGIEETTSTFKKLIFS